MGKPIVYCQGCGVSLREEDFVRGKAFQVENRPFCATCRPTTVDPPAALPAPPRGGDRPSSSGRIPRVAPGRARRPAEPAADSKAPLVIGGAIVLVAVLVLVAVMAGGGRTEPAPAAAPEEAAAPPPPDTTREDFEKVRAFAAGETDPDKTLARCDEIRSRLRGTSFELPLRAIEDRAREAKQRRMEERQVDHAVREARRIMGEDPRFLRRTDVKGMLEATLPVAGARRAEVQKLQADYEQAFDKAAQAMAEFMRSEAERVAARKKYAEAVKLLDEYPESFRDTRHYEALAALRRSMEARAAEDVPGIAAAPDGTISLSAAQARRHGNEIALKGDYLGNWHTLEDWVEWSAAPRAAGRYQAQLYYACENGSGGEFVLAAGSQTLSAKVAPTGDWKSYRTVTLGVLTLPAATTPITLKPTRLNGRGLMNLRFLRLVPEGRGWLAYFVDAGGCVVRNDYKGAKALYLEGLKGVPAAAPEEAQERLYYRTGIYNLACIYSVESKGLQNPAKKEAEDTAFKYLEWALRSGYGERTCTCHGDGWGHLRQDADMDPIRNDPRFAALVSKFEKK